MEKFFKVAGKFTAVPAVVIDGVAALRFEDKHAHRCRYKFIDAIFFSLPMVCYLHQLFLKIRKMVMNSFT